MESSPKSASKHGGSNSARSGLNKSQELERGMNDGALRMKELTELKREVETLKRNMLESYTELFAKSEKSLF